MPCSSTGSSNYPIYINDLLKQINVGNDYQLKSCACQLKTVVDSDGCPILDEDGKMGIFPFCINDDPSPTILCGDGSSVPFSEQYTKLTLKQLMTLYWRVKKIKTNLNSQLLNNNLEMERADVTNQKDLVCSKLSWGAGYFDQKAFTPCQSYSPNYPVGCDYDAERTSIIYSIELPVYRIGMDFYIKNFTFYFSKTLNSYALEEYINSDFCVGHWSANNVITQLKIGDLFEQNVVNITGTFGNRVFKTKRDVEITLVYY